MNFLASLGFARSEIGQSPGKQMERRGAVQLPISQPIFEWETLTQGPRKSRLSFQRIGAVDRVFDQGATGRSLDTLAACLATCCRKSFVVDCMVAQGSKD